MDSKLSYDPLIISRHGSKPKSSQTYKHPLENATNHLPGKSKNVNMSENLFCRKTLSSKVDLIWHLRPIRKVENARTWIVFLPYVLQKLDFRDQNIAFYLRRLISTPVFLFFFSFGAIWDLFLEEHIAFCDRLDTILKLDPKTTL